MFLMTPNGIKVHFDQERANPGIQALRDGGHLNQILVDLELWENMPNAISNLLALGAAVTTKSAWYILVFGLAGYVLGTFIKLGRYSNLLKTLFPQTLVSSIVSLILALCTGLILLQDHAIVPVVALFCVVTNNGFGHRNLFEYLTAPIRSLADKRYAKSKTIHSTQRERIFMALCDRKAKDLGVALSWQNDSTADRCSGRPG
jgi:hypothetical protein